jgi:hypothetical protein
LLVLESDPWSVLESLFCHPLRGSGISTTRILRSSVVVLYISACSCTDLMTLGCCLMEYLECLH